MIAFAAQAQITRGIKGDYITENYPEVSFIWNTADPRPMDKSQFILTENDKNIDFVFENLKAGTPKQNKKSILFLWEDMLSHKHQSENTQALLYKFFSQTSFSANDKFNVAWFNRINPGEKVLHLFRSEFTTETEALARDINSYTRSKQKFDKTGHPDESDLYLAINDGIDLLKKEPADRVGVIVVVTAGLNLKVSGASTEMETVRKKAVEAGIPIYVVKYPEYMGNTPEVNTLAENTYGTTVMLKHTMVDQALYDLQAVYKNMDARLQGQDYKLTFVTSADRDGKAHPIRLSVNKVQQELREFTAPTKTFWMWVKEHLWLCIGLILLLIGLIVLIIVLAVTSSKKRKRREAENKAEVQRKLDAASQERANWERQQAAKEEQQRNKERQKVEEAEAARLLQLMQTKNMFPRLQCTVGDETTTYQVTKPITRLGRGEGNDVVLKHQTVSKYHAKIVFTGSAFEVENKSTSYTQGIIVNGQFFQKATLKSGDIIGLGEAVVTFYV